MARKVTLFVRGHWFGISIFLILIAAAFLRFYNYQDRWGLAYDQAHDALVARYALENDKIPLVGPFSSGAPVQTGGHWYWFLMLATALYPKAVLTPWVAITLLHVLFVFLLILVGERLMDKRFGLLVGLLAAFSTAQITQSVNLTLTAPMAIISLLAIWAMINYVRYKRTKDLFFLGFFVGLAPATHLSGVGLMLFLIITLLIAGAIVKKKLVFLLLGICIPFLPNILFDLQNDFTTIRGVLQYILVEQQKISLDVLGRRWLTYAGVFWPQSWSYIIGGFSFTGYIIILGSLFFFIVNLLKRKIQKEWLILFFSFFSIVILLRYTKAPLFDSYLVFLHPFVFLLASWLIYNIYKKKKILGFLFAAIILIGSLQRNIGEIQGGGNYTAEITQKRVDALLERFPDQQFAVHAYKYKWADHNLALILFLDTHNKIDDNGRKIGIVVATQSGEFKHPIIFGETLGYQLLDLESSSSGELQDAQLGLVNPSVIYRATENWYQKK